MSGIVKPFGFAEFGFYVANWSIGTSMLLHSSGLLCRSPYGSLVMCSRLYLRVFALFEGYDLGFML